MRLPDFLVIGAMKSGTTTLYHDLAVHPQIFLADKELGALAQDAPMAAYAGHFHRAKLNQLCGDVSTVYSMLPDVPDVAERAVRCLSPNTKIIYLVREPIQRAISHHYHYHSLRDDRQMGADIDACVRRYPSLANYGKYSEQLELWSSRWGENAVHVIRFEDYIAERGTTMARVFRFLGLLPIAHAGTNGSVKNASVDKPVLNNFWRRVTQHRLYRQSVRPYLSLAMRDRLRAALLPTAPPPPAPPRPETIDHLLSSLISDGERLRQRTNRPSPFWDYSTVRAVHLDRWRQWQAERDLRMSA